MTLIHLMRTRLAVIFDVVWFKRLHGSNPQPSKCSPAVSRRLQERLFQADIATSLCTLLPTRLEAEDTASADLEYVGQLQQSKLIKSGVEIAAGAVVAACEFLAPEHWS